MATLNVLQNRLSAAESKYNSAFSVITKIQESSDEAMKAAQEEAQKAETKKLEFMTRQSRMERTVALYKRRSEKITAFIKSLDD